MAKAPRGRAEAGGRRAARGERRDPERDHPGLRRIDRRHGDAHLRGVERRLRAARSRAAARGMAARPRDLRGFDPCGRLSELVGEKLDRDALEREVREPYLAACETQPLLPGVVDLLEEARSIGLGTAVASSATRGWVTGWLGKHGIGGLFDAVCGREDVPRVKPAPDLFLLAALRLGVAPPTCLVFEDSPNGIRAARAAGMRCVAVPNPVTRPLDLGGPDLVLGRAAEISTSPRSPAASGSGLAPGEKQDDRASASPVRRDRRRRERRLLRPAAPARTGGRRSRHRPSSWSSTAIPAASCRARPIRGSGSRWRTGASGSTANLDPFSRGRPRRAVPLGAPSLSRLAVAPGRSRGRHCGPWGGAHGAGAVCPSPAPAAPETWPSRMPPGRARPPASSPPSAPTREGRRTGAFVPISRRRAWRRTRPAVRPRPRRSSSVASTWCTAWARCPWPPSSRRAGECWTGSRPGRGATSWPRPATATPSPRPSRCEPSVEGSLLEPGPRGSASPAPARTGARPSSGSRTRPLR